MAATLDFYSVWYRDHLVMKIAKSEQLHFDIWNDFIFQFYFFAFLKIYSIHMGYPVVVCTAHSHIYKYIVHISNTLKSKKDAL